jgi:hypothetical protein
MDNRASNLELTARVVLPALTLIAYVVVNLQGKSPRLYWLLIAFGICFSILSYYSPLQSELLKWKSARDDRQTARKAFPELLSLIDRFEQFVNRQTSDTLHYMVASDIYQGRADLRADCQLPNVDLWYVTCQYFSERMNRVPRTMAELKPALMEFHFLIGSYNNFCVSPIFETFPANLRAQIQPAIVAKLNLFHLKFTRFLEDYQLFARPLSEARPILEGIPYSFAMPRPMI